MKIVIDIPKEIYENAQNDLLCCLPILTEAIKNGTPLPEHHGRLIDADAIKYRLNCMNGDICVSNAPSCAECLERAVTKAEIDEIPTIIPATKEGDRE